MSTTVKKVLAWTLAGIAGALVLASGLAKLTGAQAVVEGLTKVGVGDYIFVLGIMELVFVALFLVPSTSKIGFLLVTCYFAGALGTDLSHGNPLLTPTLILVMVWIATFLRTPEVFIFSRPVVKN